MLLPLVLSTVLLVPLAVDAVKPHPNYYCIYNDKNEDYANVTLCQHNQRPLEFGKDMAAYAKFSDRALETGWAELELVTNVEYTDFDQMFYAGYLEGYITSNLIEDFRNNLLRKKYSVFGVVDGEYCNKYYDFIKNNRQWTFQTIDSNLNNQFLQQINLLAYQLTGMDYGFAKSKTSINKKGPEKKFYYCEQLLVNLYNELDSINHLIGKDNSDKLSDEPVSLNSALIRYFYNRSTGDYDVMMGHNSWGHYRTMNRIMKRYTFNLSSSNVKTLVMSSYPGMIYSADNFYITDQQLVIQQTWLQNFNQHSWDKVNGSEIVFEFMRMMAANRLATTGQEWADLFSEYNQAIQSEQFMIADFKQHKSGEFKHGFLTVMEQMGKKIHYRDQTELLVKQGYWASFNVPFYETIYNFSNSKEMVELHGDYFSYANNPRAKIMERDHTKATDLDSMYKLMRYNNFQEDVLSACSNCTPPYNSEFAIAARSDLNSAEGQYPSYQIGFQPVGTIDTKIVSSKMVASMEMIAVSGPTNEDVESFNWAHTELTDVNFHQGQPTFWNFKPIFASWKKTNESFDYYNFK